MTSRSRISAFERLKDLPEVFTLKTAADALGCTPRMASTYIARWKEAGMAASLGPRAGVHFNLVRNPDAASEHRMAAVALLFPGAVIGGVSAVHAAGWTTQFPRQTEIMIPNCRSFPQVEDAEIQTRSLRWMRAARSWVRQAGDVPWLDPAFALADCVASGNWVPDPDDIEWDEVDATALRRSFDWFEIDIPEDWHEEIDLAQSGMVPED